MKKGIISKSLLLSFIGVLLCISMFVGTTLALFSITAKTDVNKVGIFNISVKYDSTYNGTFANDLKGVKLFDDVAITPGSDSELRFIKITNNYSGSVNVSLKLTDVSMHNSGWSICTVLNPSNNNVSFIDDNVKTISNDLEFFTAEISKNSHIIIAVAIRLDSNSEDQNFVSFKIDATVTQQV